MIQVLAAFERRLISGNSLYDRARRGEATLSESAARGQEMFFSETFECHHCHGGFNLTIAVDFATLAEPGVAFFNTGSTTSAGPAPTRRTIADCSTSRSSQRMKVGSGRRRCAISA